MRPGRHRGWFRILALLVKPVLWALTRPQWRGFEVIPSEGGVLVVANHVSPLDPLTLAHAIYDGGRRLPRYLAKAELFGVPVIGWLLRLGCQIPVSRGTRDAAASLQVGQAALAAGELVVIYPEGTCTRDPNGWPMAGKTGVARLALGCDVPVVPVAHWGAHRILGYRSKWPNLIGRKQVRAVAGAPIDLSSYRGVEPTNEVLREVTDLLMSRVKELLGQLRGETPPAGFFAPRGEAAVSGAARIDGAKGAA